MKGRTKYYSKETFKQEEKIKSVIVVICIFLIGFLTGYACMNSAIEDRQETNIIESEEK